MLNFFLETFRLGLKNLRLHKLRSLLTALGIILGVAAVIVMVAIGEGAKQSALEQMRQLGARNIVIRSVPPPESNDATARTQRILEYGLKRLDLRRLQTLPNLEAIVPLRDTGLRVVYQDRRVPASAMATTPNAFGVINLRLERGRTFNQVDYDHETPVCVLGALASRQLFPFQDPIGEQIKVSNDMGASAMLTVVGVLESTGLRAEGAALINRNLDMDVYFPLSLAQSVFGDNIVRRQPGFFERKTIELSEIWLQTTDIQHVESMAALAENIVQLNHSSADYQVAAPIQILRNAEKLNKMFNFIMVSIASFSLVVGGIGIMNIMLATVTERTREIGIRRALGAKRRHIVLQFLIETTVISLTGGMIGILLGTVIGLGLPPSVLWLTGQVYPTQIASWSVFGSCLISALIGIGFGLYPAVIAANMNPIEALRHE